MLRLTLVHFGHTVIEARKGRDGAVPARERRPGDHGHRDARERRPRGCDGASGTASCREDHRDLGCRQRGLSRLGPAMGAAKVLLKPFTNPRLMTAINGLLPDGI